MATFEYPDVPKDVFRRHRYCDCTVEYDPEDGKKVNVYTKKLVDPENAGKIEARIEYSTRYSGASGAKNYFRDESNDDFLDEESKRREKHAYREYDRIKNSDQKLEKRKIYNNIGRFKTMRDFTKKDVNIAFDHVFNDIHELEKGKMLFEPDYSMAQSWSRLINNKDIQEHDLILLRHERLEHDYMYRNRMNYDEAHEKVSEIYLYKNPKEDDK